MKSSFLLILASESPRRKALLKELGLRLKIVPADVQEIPRWHEDPISFAKRMAEEKAEIVSSFYPDQWVLGADTVVVLGKKILGKPKDSQEAKRFLRLLSGKTHRVITGFCLQHRATNRSFCRSVSTRVSFKSLSTEEIAWYVRTYEPLDKAGAYAIQGKGAFCVKKIQGSYTNVVGLPVTEVLEVLEKYTGFELGHP
ncbi:MAG: septum formation protein Maf [Deltaproteobacteria bacterium RBG_13_43_22]|nr:MAG: septum formation protein Maf [Deltaproteobacteria bacterium RBG_13_43_22]